MKTFAAAALAAALFSFAAQADCYLHYPRGSTACASDAVKVVKTPAAPIVQAAAALKAVKR